MEGSSVPGFSQLFANILERFDMHMAIQTMVLCVFIFAGLKIIISSLQPMRRYRSWERTNGTITHIEAVEYQKKIDHSDDEGDYDIEEMIQPPKSRLRRRTRVEYSYHVMGQTLKGSVFVRKQDTSLPNHFVEGKSVQVAYHPIHVQKSKLLDESFQVKRKGRFIGVFIGAFFVGIALYLLLPEILGIPVNFGPLAR